MQTRVYINKSRKTLLQFYLFIYLLNCTQNLDVQRDCSKITCICWKSLTYTTVNLLSILRSCALRDEHYFHMRIGTSTLLSCLTILTAASLVVSGFHLLNYFIVTNGDSEKITQPMLKNVNNQYIGITPVFNSSNWTNGYDKFAELLFNNVGKCFAPAFGISAGVLLGVATQSGFLLAVFTSLLGVLDAFEIITFIVGLMNSNIWRTGLKEFLTDTQKLFVGANATNFESVFWNYIQNTNHCCGVHNPNEWNTTVVNWTRTVNYSTINFSLYVPLSCCRALHRGVPPNCILTTELSNTIFNQGCLENVGWNLYYLDATDLKGVYGALIIIHTAIVALYIAYRQMRRKEMRIYLF
ncbi:hypothetical protein EG68_06712 [Paragonimus skrjabini miyazakii]|uniref:Tetraspanin n=1 Tax=Paragonimus skrjabini miyazakii TaxID=59628 RepID=A0A8S9YDM4_9TREM|nr:hypothetical protein EG68_06712 [Paragonimus skrjabini miyazakii]